MNRCSGILMPVFSLPSPYGIGTLGKAAYDFADFLHAAGQHCWQMLPLGPTSYGDSPYQSFSTYAGNPYFIDLELLIEDGLLTRDEVESQNWGTNPRYVDYGRIYESRFAVLQKAKDRGWVRDQAEVAAFQAENSRWLPDYALYMACKRHFGMRSWTEWEDADIRLRKSPEVLERYRTLLREDVELFTYLQFLFFRQWNKLRDYLHGLDIQVIGDLPIYVDHDSVEVWRHPGSFQLDDDLRPTAVSGVPPDAFSATGQVWYHPLYRWDALQRDGFSWWTQRVARALATVDLLRIDHFRGLVAYWAVPAGSATAVTGQWMPAPGRALLATLARRFPCLPVIAEDLGLITPDVRELVREFGIPGMRVLLFAFDSSPGENIHLPHHVVRDSVVYTGTHDNNPVRGWLETEATDAQRDRLFAYLGREVAPADLPWTLVRLALSTVAETAIVPVQDLLGLGAGARMNRPGTHAGNWRWRLAPGELTPAVVDRLAAATRTYDRT